MGSKEYRIFVSHASDDLWVAERIAEKIESTGASTFLDRRDIAAGDNFKQRIREEIPRCSELIALFTPWSRTRGWVRHEIGMADGLGKRIVCVFYKVKISDFDKDGDGRAALDDMNVIELDAFGDYLRDLRNRIGST